MPTYQSRLLSAGTMMARLKYLYFFVGCCLFCMIALLSLLFKALAGSQSAIDVALEINDAANVATGGKRGEKVSSRAWRNRYDSRFWAIMTRVINLLFLNKNHCMTSYQSDRARGVYEKAKVVK
ncbi:MAG: hypothetical protein ACO1N8_06350 [Methylophilus sp.]